MSWDRVVGQGRAKATLQRAIAQNRVGHAYLFFGPSGVGKLASALAFAQALLCERGGEAPCGECNACHKVLRRMHADLRIHLPFPKAGDKGQPPADLARRILAAAEDPYVRADYRTRPSLDKDSDTSNKLARYPIEYVRDELIHPQSFRPVEGRYRIAIVTDAELLHTQGSNALLKALEEPPAHTVNILISDRPDALLTTIRSRCEQVRFVRLDVPVLEAALIERGVATTSARTFARMADGSFSQAVALSADTGLVERHEQALRLLEYSGAGDVERLGPMVEEIAGFGRERTKATLAAVLAYVRDLFVFSETRDPDRIVNIDQAAALEALAGRYPSADCAAMVDLVEQGLVLVDRQVHMKLLLMTLIQRIGRAMRGREAGPLYLPLAASALP